MTGCLACSINEAASAPGGVIAENGEWLADHCIGPMGVGAVVVKTKAHRESLWEMTRAESVALGPFLKRVSAAIVEALGAERVYMVMWVDMEPYHLHMVLQPRYPGMPEELGGKGLTLQNKIAELGPPDPDEARRAAQKLRAYLREGESRSSSAGK